MIIMTNLAEGHHPASEPLVLIVDDDAGIRSYLRRCLGPITHRVYEAADGVEALAVARAESVDLIVTDVVMPRMDGFEFHAVLRADPTFAAIPVLFVSGELTSVPEGTLLQKPFNARTLRAAVHAVLPSS